MKWDGYLRREVRRRYLGQSLDQEVAGLWDGNVNRVTEVSFGPTSSHS